MKKAILSGAMAIPLSRIDVSLVKKEQTHQYWQMGEELPCTVTSYRIDGEYIHVPRQYGIDVCRKFEIDFIDETSPGVPVTFPRIPEPRDYQVAVLDEVQDRIDSYFDFVFRARTGFGKTISALIIAARLGVSTLILVDQDNLKDQWVEALGEHFGIPLKDVGIIQGRVCSYKGKAVTIAMIHTLSQKRLPDEVYSYFGFMVVDEVHTAGAPTFSAVLMDFSATSRIGVSATPKRRDGLQKLLDYNLGKVRVYVADEHKRSSLYIAEHPTVYSWYANTSPKVGRYLTEVSEDGSRNLLVAESAVMLYESGRDTLVLGDRIEQLQHLMNLCYYLGIPPEEMGLYTGQEYVYGYEVQPVPPRRPEGWERRTEYTPVSLKLIAKKTPKKKLKAIKEGARLIFATYAMFSKGIDVPRLAGGVDATPRSTAEQMHGRILREMENKLPSIWVTIADVSSYRSIHQLVGRLADYQRNNAALFRLNEDGSTEPCQPNELTPLLREQVERLKSARIEPVCAGLNTLLFPGSLTAFERKIVSGIKRPTQQPRSSRTVSNSPEPSVRSPTRTSSTRPVLIRSRSPNSRKP